MSEKEPSPPGALTEGSVGLGGVFAMSVGSMGVSSVVALVVPLVAVTAGNGGWLTWAICTVVILSVAWSIARLSRRFAGSGGIYGLAAKGFGPGGAVLVGWTMVTLGGILSGFTVVGFGIYTSSFLSVVGFPTNRATILLLNALCLGIAWFASYRGMQDSVKVMLAIEVTTISVIAVLMVAVLVTHRGPIVDRSQLDLTGTSLHPVILGIVLAVLAFAGFESAAVLGREARDPRRCIPLAMVSTVVVAGMFWLSCGYVVKLGFEGSHFNLATSSSPLGDLARIAGIGPYRYLVSLTVAMTLLGTTIAVLNSVARFMLTMAEEKVAPASWARLHAVHGSPCVAVHWLGASWLVTIGVVTAFDIGPFVAIDFLSDLGGYGFMLMYAVVVAGAVLYFRRTGTLQVLDVAIACFAIGAMGYVFYSNVVPFPTSASEIVVLAIFVLNTAGILAAYIAARRRPGDRLAAVGTTVDESAV